MVRRRLHRHEAVTLLANRLAEGVESGIHITEGERDPFLLELLCVVLLDVCQRVLVLTPREHGNLDQRDGRLDLRINRPLLRDVDGLHAVLKHVKQITKAQVESSQTHDALCVHIAGSSRRI